MMHTCTYLLALLSVQLNVSFVLWSQFDNHVFIAVNGDGTETEEMMMRKLHAFNRILGMLYGPVTQR